ncbi:hypothetical protein AMK26_04255 [Streptomyces sp. CB03234]|uniref:winged helix-turn-helix domain-containing protein n=1 Tax=Streptomyces sp. (strain CB03234) TaxID=1703937 RepID=UPI00093A5707|nr:winged helix-turn-helix domain-containing protein [Streptomyces sp. CB03234]OKK08235.1 hypothetical protein AMK26_04255 [Streptomyces sp. CB03234]
MANTRTLSAVPATATATATSVSNRHRLRAVDERDEPVRLPGGVDVAEFLPPGATWVPAPPHTVPSLPGQPPMVGYLVLVPAGAPGEGPDGSDWSHGSDWSDGPVTIDGARRTARVAGRPLDLTYLEFELLAHLVAHPHRVHTRDHLVTTVWGYGHVGDGRTVDVHVARLRRKLGAEHRHTIRTVRRVGYTYAP